MQLPPAPPADWPQKPAGISLCMIVRNEEKFLGDCLRSVQGAVDEINIVDTGSNDRTVHIARGFGAHVLYDEWKDDFSYSRNKSLALAKYRWVLVLDADEILVQASREELMRIAHIPAGLIGYYIRCYSLTDEYSGTGTLVSNAIVRIFPNSERIRWRDPIHELISLDNAISGMPALPSEVAILHRGYLNNVVVKRDKNERNVTICEKALREAPDDPFRWYNFGTSVASWDGDLAIRAFQVMRELNGGRQRGYIPAGLMHLANMLMMRTRIEDAEEVAAECARLVPTFVNAHFLHGQILHVQNKIPEAKSAYLKSINAGEYDQHQFYCDHEIAAWKGYTQLAGLCLDAGDFEMALAWCEKGLMKRPRNQLLRLNRARALERLGDLDEAEEAYRTAWEDDGDEFTTLDYAGFLCRSWLFEDARAVILKADGNVSPEAKETALAAIPRM